MSPDAIDHLIAAGRLHRIFQGVYAVGRPGIDRYGTWMAAVLAAGPRALLSHITAAILWGLLADTGGPIEVSVPVDQTPERPGIVVHRRTSAILAEGTTHHAIPVTCVAGTLIDLAARLRPGSLERAVSEADRLDLIDPEALRATLRHAPRRPGIGVLKRTLDRHTFSETDSELERRFLRLVERGGLPKPRTRQIVNGVRVDFHWPALGLIVETDGLRYHRTPAQQAADRSRDQTHTAAGLTTLRFTHAQVVREPEETLATTRATIRHLGLAERFSGPPPGQSFTELGGRWAW